MSVSPLQTTPWLILLGAALVALPTLTSAGTRIQNDPQGFNGIPWGAPLSELKSLKQVETSNHMQGYDLAEETPRLGEISLDYMRLFAVYDQFARVTIRYEGEKTHKQVLAYLEETFGSVEHSPNSMIRGLNQVFNWRGTYTEINLTYDGFRERGYLFIESRKLAPRFNDGYSDRAF